jgi:DNA modification methylase
MASPQDPHWTNSKINWRSRIVRYGKIRADQIIPHPNNPRTHPIEQRKAVEASFDVLGQIAPIIINERNGYLVDGAERSWLALAQGDETEVDAIWLDLSDDEHALALASFDWITQMATYDRAALDSLLQEVDTDNAALQSLLNDLAIQNDIVLDPVSIPDDVAPQIDRAAVLQQEWQTERGQVWVIGKHRLMCGDSTNAVDVARLMGGVKADACVTDVPYGISQDSNGLRRLDYGEWDKDDATKVAIESIKLCKDIPTITAFCGDEQLSLLLSLWGNRTRRTVAWVKPNPTVLNGEHVFLPAIELAAHGRMGGAWFGGHCVRSVWEGTASRDRIHPTEKPTELFVWLIENTCPPKGNAYDPFSGSGTTMIACEQTGRVCYGMEIAPEYCAVTLQRLKDMGLSPVLDSSPSTHEIEF